MIQDTIEREIDIEAPPERVWALVTQAEHLGRWFGDAGASVDLRPGGALAFRWTEHGETDGRVEAVEPPHRFTFRWRAPGEFGYGEGPLGPENSTLVEFALTPHGAGTRLRVVEQGFAALAGADEARGRHRDGNVRGWQAELGELAEYATGATAGA
ncbi:SRPBCC family protein [Patulibacter americanus]|uniref:SRPBCC family protein n=1 Tax=Patulibacter americanus TaxID=588672 RepID=UPI0003B3E84E|nr:SRPBCC family protein [Patulibacter americanus]